MTWIVLRGANLEGCLTRLKEDLFATESWPQVRKIRAGPA